jgi:glycosyltransferase involved in cell wall biosynthesis
MSAVVYAETLGRPADARIRRLARETGAFLLAHAWLDRQSPPPRDLCLVDRRRTLLDALTAPFRYARSRHPHTLPFGTALEMAERLTEMGATAVHAHHGVAALLIAPLARRLGLRLVVSLYGTDFENEDPAYRRALDALLREADPLLVPSDALLRRVSAPGVRAETLPFGIESAPFRPRRPRSGEPARCLVFTTGRADAAERALVAASALGASLDTRFFAPGEEEEARRSLPACDLLIWLDGEARDGPPELLLRALDQGLPVVAQRAEGIEEVVEPGVNGVLVDPSEPGRLAEAIRDLANDPVGRLAYGAAGRVRVETRYSVRKAALRLREIYAGGA